MQLYKMSQTLNETLLKLKFEITRLSESLTDSKIWGNTPLLVFIKIVIDKKTAYDIIRVYSKSATKQIKIKGSEKLLLFY